MRVARVVRAVGIWASVAVVAAGSGCRRGPTEADKQKLAATIEALRPGMARIAALYAALPSAAEAREVPLKAPIAAEGLETVDVANLEAMLGRPTSTGEAPRPFIVSEALQGQHVGYLEPDHDADFGYVMNVGNRVKALAGVKHVVVFRPSEVDKGKLGGVDGKGAVVIERAASWKGWVFVFAFEDPARLVGAFPMEARSRDELTLVVREGYAPDPEALLDDAVFGLKRASLERITAGR